MTSKYPWRLLFLAALCVCSTTACSNSNPDAASVPAADAGSSGDQSSAAAAPPIDEALAAQWLSSNLPSVIDGLDQPPVTLASPQISANEFGQEQIQVEYSRPTVVRTLAAHVELVLLPATGGRASVFVAPGILIQPADRGVIQGFTENLLDHRGRVRSGLRAYLQMRAATAFNSDGPPQRVSNIVWIGSDEQLRAAMAKGPPPDVTHENSVIAPTLQAVGEMPLPRGMPLWMRCGERWTRGYVFETTDSEPVKLLIYLVRRGTPYKPWIVELPRAGLRVEPAVLEELQASSGAFHDISDSLDSRLARHGAPYKLQPLTPADLTMGAAVLTFSAGMLDPCTVQGPVTDGVVLIRRTGWDNAEQRKNVAELYADPLAEQAESP